MTDFMVFDSTSKTKYMANDNIGQNKYVGALT
jgi:hypothetical protein